MLVVEFDNNIMNIENYKFKNFEDFRKTFD